MGVRWKTGQVVLTIDRALDAIAPDIVETVRTSELTWSSVGAATPTIDVKAGDVDAVGYRLDGRNQSTLRVVPKNDPLAKNTLAATVLTYDANSGAILDADVVVNGGYHFSNVEADPPANKTVYDLQSVLTHEFGHFQGLNDDYEHEAATMYVVTSPGDTRKRSLDAEDEDAIVSLYPYGQPESDQPVASCGTAWGRASSPLLMTLLLGLGVFCLRRRHAGSHAAAIRCCAAALLAGTSAASAATVPASTALARVGVATASIGRAASHWQGGIIVSEVELSIVSCDGDCAALPKQIVLPGGRVGDIVQVVSHSPSVEAGGRVVIELFGEHEATGQRRVISSIRVKRGADHD